MFARRDYVGAGDRLRIMSTAVHSPGTAYDPSRIRHPHFQGLITDAASAVSRIAHGDTVAISGFASAGTPICHYLPMA